MFVKILELTLLSKYFWIAILVIYVYLKFFVYAYWKRRGIPYEVPRMPFSNAVPTAFGKISLGNYFKAIYEKFNKHRYNGIFMLHQPVLMINDPELIQTVLVKQFNKFPDRGMYHNETIDPLTNNLFFLPGEKWRKLRTKLTPTFSASKLKDMFPLVKEIASQLIVTCDDEIDKNHVVAIKDLMARYTTDSISSVAFGFNCKSLQNPKSDFKHHGECVFDMPPIINAFAAFAWVILDIFRIPLFPAKVTRFFSNTFADTLKYRRQQNVLRKDFVNLLMELMDVETSNEDDKLTFCQAQAQAFIFFLGGFETSSSTMTYLLYELARHPDIQDDVHKEIDQFFQNGQANYDRIKKELPYLDMVFSETLRMHPTFPFLTRKCAEDWQIPGTKVTINKGTGIVISVSGIQRDPDLYPDPDTFDPTRFNEQNIAARSPFVYLPFGTGPRICIGYAFALLQTKLALLYFLRSYKLYTCDKTTIPIEYSKRSFTQTPAGEVYLRLEKRGTSINP